MEPTQSGENKSEEMTQMHHRIYQKLETHDPRVAIESYRKHYGHGYTDDILYTSHLTGLHPKVILKLKHDSLLKHDIHLTIDEVDRSILLKELTNFYLNKHIMPTTRDMFDALEGKLPIYVDIATFRKQLALMDFMWKNIRNRFYVIERPEITYERYKFLKLVLEYHDNDHPIFFIDTLVYAPKCFYTSASGNRMSRPRDSANVIYAITKKGALYKIVGEYSQKEFKSFICDVLIPNLTEHSLIVIKNSNYCCEKDMVSKPNIESTKEDMMKWLDRNNVPYEDFTSKAELYLLIQKCTNHHHNTYLADSILKANGHNVIRIPDHIEKLTPTTHFFDLIQYSYSELGNENLAAQGIMFQIFNTIDEQRLAQMYDIVVNKYKSLYQDDIKVDDVLDSLIAKMDALIASSWTHTGAEDSDIPSDEDN